MKYGIGTAAGTLLMMSMLLLRAMPAAALPAPELEPQSVQSGSLLFRMKHGYVTATRIESDVRIRISGLVARVSLRQEFRNDGKDWVEGVYVFPLPDRSAVDHMKMRVGERVIEGEIRERQEAREKYEQARKQGKRASLVEQERANLFTTSVANIAPGATVAVEIQYLEVLRFDEGSFSLRFPLTMTPRYIPGTATSDRKGSGWSPDTLQVGDASLITPPVVARSDSHTVTINAELDAGVPLAYIASRYHDIDVSDDAGRYKVALAAGDVPMDHDFELVWRPVPDASPRAMLFSEVIQDRKHLLLMLLPPNELSTASEPVARELIFVIDTSGSMHGTSIEQAKKALTVALGGLRPVDRFNVIQFNSSTSAFRRAGVPATQANVDGARRYIHGLEADGGTEMRPALKRALRGDSEKGALRQIIFVTDGSVGNEEELFGLIEDQLGGSRLFTVGIGSAPNGWFMRKAAELGRGTYTYVSALHEVEERMDRLFRKLEQPQVTGIEVRWPSGVAVESYPAPVPDLYAGEPVVVKARLSDAARDSDLIVIGGTSALGGWSAELPLDIEEQGAGVAALWARAKIENLMDQSRRSPGEANFRQAVTETALAYHLVSKYTSLVAVDKTPQRPQHAGLSKEQLASLLPHGQVHEAICSRVLPSLA
jgi:Ca-activated chloride channel family protein